MRVCACQCFSFTFFSCVLLLLSVFSLMFRCIFSETEGSDIDADLSLPAAKRKKLAREDALQKAKSSGKYPEFIGLVGPADELDPSVVSCLDFVKLLWPNSLCQHIAEQTNLYARQQCAKGWHDTNSFEVWLFLGIILQMGIHRLPEITDYWARDPLLQVDAVRNAMSLKRFQSLWRYLHCEDNESITDSRDVTSKIKTVLGTLEHTYFTKYNPSQELSVDEMMIKFKGRKSGKIHMPKKPVKLGFKVWACSCSCCGYLCTFSVYNGRLSDSSGKKVPQKGLVKDVVHGLLERFYGQQHVVYMDNFYTSGPLIEELRSQGVFTVGTILKNAAGFPTSLKGVVPDKGSYVSQTVGDICYSVFNDRKVVCFATNVFPDTVAVSALRRQSNGSLHSERVPTCLPAYNTYMGGVDNTGRMRKTYGYDRKCKRYWFRLFFHFLDLTVNNAHLLHKHNCTRVGVKSMTLKHFRLEVIRSLLSVSSTCDSLRAIVQSRSDSLPPSQVKRVSVRSVGVSRGRCQECVVRKIPPKEQGHTSMACPQCHLRLCEKHSFGHTCDSTIV